MDGTINNEGSGGGSGDASTSGTGGAQAPAAPEPISAQANAPPPFLSKTYDMGFRKVDPDRWEFANEGFLRGQKHLLKSISRRKPAHGHAHQPVQKPHGQNSSVGACVEVGKFGLEEEVERLKRDKNVLMQELVRLRQQQQATDGQLQAMFVQQQNESNRRITEANKKRRLKQDGISENENSSAPDGQIVKYKPLINEAAKAMLRQMMKMDACSGIESYNNGLEVFLIGSGSPSSSGMESGRSSSHISEVTLQEVTPTTGDSTYVPAASGHDPAASISEIKCTPCIPSSEKITASQLPDMSALVGSQEAPSISVPQSDVVMPTLSQIPEMVPESIVDIPGEGYEEPETGNDGFMDLTLVGIENVPSDPDIDMLLENSSFWDELVQSPVLEDIESSSVDGEAKGNDVQPMDSGWDKTQHMDQLAEQMGLLTSDAKKL
ncbi:hypothetical protein GH714_001396 [Hevea brasiliensis]|uniref:HSF-type DNA-binding domain-containing protein n=1 Tax=Hevea brasiliensis TaxID=3981 RepID=A0A6A6LXE3_HEVBR|nr:hypothetical protein GH714_001396 [Hevea brasiliensis]